MEETFSLSWDSHQHNICNGLSQLQQCGEFVDMTLAADGHYVKVHRMVLSLASPYIKDLISTAQCPNPIIFLNDVSYKTLSAILEYIYTGQVVISKESLPDLIRAGKALHIKGLTEIVVENEQVIQSDKADKQSSEILKIYSNTEKDLQPMCRVFIDSDDDNTMEIDESKESKDKTETKCKKILGFSKNKKIESGKVQYSISNQGNLQAIVNGFIYNLKYVQKNNIRYWRCTDYAYKKCPANVHTNDKNEVVKRRSSHNHSFHERKIMQKLRMKGVFGGFSEAEDITRRKKAGEQIIVQ